MFPLGGGAPFGWWCAMYFGGAKIFSIVNIISAAACDNICCCFVNYIE